MHSDAAVAHEDRLHLVEDEVVTFDSRATGHRSFRVRVWMGRGRHPVVLIRAADGLPTGDSWMAKVCNYVRVAILRYGDAFYLLAGPRVFATCSDGADARGAGRDDAIRVFHFEAFGPVGRGVLCRPICQKFTWAKLDALVGSTVDT